MHIVRVCERLPRLKIQFRISRSFRPRNQANLGSKSGFWIHRKEHNQKKFFLIPRCGFRIGQIPSLAGCRGILRFQSPGFWIPLVKFPRFWIPKSKISCSGIHVAYVGELFFGSLKFSSTARLVNSQLIIVCLLPVLVLLQRHFPQNIFEH